jgi:hypothetical protein
MQKIVSTNTFLDNFKIFYIMGSHSLMAVGHSYNYMYDGAQIKLSVKD